MIAAAITRRLNVDPVIRTMDGGVSVADTTCSVLHTLAHSPLADSSRSILFRCAIRPRRHMPAFFSAISAPLSFLRCWRSAHVLFPFLLAASLRVLNCLLAPGPALGRAHIRLTSSLHAQRTLRH